jgi:hypothetical protein
MYSELTKELPGFKNISCDVRRGITHTEIRVMGDSLKTRNPGFVADVYVNRRTQDHSIARIDNRDEKILSVIRKVVSGFKF